MKDGAVVRGVRLWKVTLLYTDAYYVGSKSISASWRT